MGRFRGVCNAQDLLPTEHPRVVLDQSAATRAAVLDALPSSRFVLLATHGFFAPPEHFSVLDATQRRGISDPQMLSVVQELSPDPWIAKPSVLTSVVGRNPLSLAGLVLAGANRGPGSDSLGMPLACNGLLTAEEIAGLRLDATELVVLSACASGLGEVIAGEGVFGLQRAFALAGARTVIASLWHVDDDATQTLMTEFYRELWQNGRGKLEALAHAQRTMLDRYDPETKRLRPNGSGGNSEASRLAPYYWAAFSLSGDWR